MAATCMQENIMIARPVCNHGLVIRQLKKKTFALLLKDDCNFPKSTNFAQLVSSTPVWPVL